MTEVIQTVKHPKSLSRSVSHDALGKIDEQDKFNLNYVLPESAGTRTMNAPSRLTPKYNAKSRSMSTHDAGQTFGDSGRISSMG